MTDKIKRTSRRRFVKRGVATATLIRQWRG